jgi:hypothetical protein
MRAGSGRAARRARGAGLLLVTGALSLGCRDNGLPDRNLPLDQAQRRTFNYPAYQPYAGAVEVWELAGHRWQASARVETIQARLLRSVANANGTAVYALSWDQPPHDRLYTPVGENRWLVIERVQ